jgi:hypothetical protein
MTAQLDGGRWVWRTDGTAAGTVPLRIPDVRASARAGLLGVVDDRAVLRVAGDPGARGLWAVDGLGRARRLPGPRDPERLWFDREPFSDKVLVLDDDPLGTRPLALWSTDGTPQGTKRLTYIGGRAGRRHDLIGSSQFLDDRAYFFSGSSDGTDKTHLWVTDGARAGTRRVIALPTSSRLPAWDTPLIGLGKRRFVFGTRDGVWGSDGTGAGTERIAKLHKPTPLGDASIQSCARADGARRDPRCGTAIAACTA